MTELLSKEHFRNFQNSCVVVCAGFEERAIQFCDLLAENKATINSAVVVTYDDDRNKENESTIRARLQAALPDGQEILNGPLSDPDELVASIAQAACDSDHVYCDITGLNTVGMFQVLDVVHRQKKPFSILYTEAESYRPTEAEIQSVIGDIESDENLASLWNYEISESLYSSACEVDLIDGFEGRSSAGYPDFLISFLPFKRSRLAAVIEDFATTRRLLILGKPERPDLAWRIEALKNINEDFVFDGATEVVEISTLNYVECLNLLSEMYLDPGHGNRFKYNFLVSPLGSKMQKLACWIFGKQNPRVMFIAAQPIDTYAAAYSAGFRDTFIAKDVHEHLESDREFD